MTFIFTYFFHRFSSLFFYCCFSHLKCKAFWSKWIRNFVGTPKSFMSIRRARSTDLMERMLLGRSGFGCLSRTGILCLRGGFGTLSWTILLGSMSVSYPCFLIPSYGWNKNKPLILFRLDSLRNNWLSFIDVFMECLVLRNLTKQLRLEFLKDKLIQVNL